ncbi:MAG: iron-sulfur cluster assembly scaffold protein [Hadesarchaea archaeon]|nr:iron-sulfur cluster assembly scaffold protein [Candidatus Bipolaricaulota bacterium]MBC7218942.1 iron-sulfur cluster assembly scaffold protein [Hadesarchaea archaeon]
MLKYSEKLLERFRNPKNIGEMENPTVVAEEGDPQCGDMFRMFLKIENDRIVDARFLSFGCAANIATGDVTVDLIKGKTVDEAEKLQIKEIAEALGGLPAIKMHCAVLSYKTLKKALAEYRKTRSGAGPQG